MKTLKLNFTIPQDVADTLKARINKRKRSAFVAAAVREKLKELEQEELRQNLIEGYRAMIDDSIEIDRQFEAATLEDWPE